MELNSFSVKGWGGGNDPKQSRAAALGGLSVLSQTCPLVTVDVH